jgi:hypothetical protein
MRTRRKKTQYLILIFFITFVFIQNLFSQSSNLKEFLPLNIGNTWVYYYNGAWPFGPFSGFEKYRIISTYYANGKLYFKFAHFRVAISGPSNVVLQSRLFKDTAAIRIDSLSGNICRNISCHSSQELLVDSLNAGLNDTFYTCEPAVDDTVICTDTNSIIYFESPRISRKFDMPGFEGQTMQIYAKNLGLVGYTFQIMNQTTWGTLKGCVINGVVYGDTSMVVGIKQISNEVPENYSLSQNYPNPFNPTTKIKFDIPPLRGARGVITLIVFDILGREVATLVNEQLNPGTYEVEWDGDNYPSGVYFYKLITADYTETKRMVLVK